MNELIPENIVALHSAYLSAMGFEPEDLPLSQVFIRWWHDAAKEGLTGDGVKLCIKERIRFNNSSQFKRGIELRHLIRSEEDIAVALNEIAVIRARMRVKLLPAGKCDVLRATGRSDEIATDPAKHVRDVKLIQDLKSAAGM